MHKALIAAALFSVCGGVSSASAAGMAFADAGEPHAMLENSGLQAEAFERSSVVQPARGARGEGRRGRPGRGGRKAAPLSTFRAQFDLDADGRLSREEAVEARADIEAYHTLLVGQFDGDGDGALSDAEWAVVLPDQPVKAERPERGGGKNRAEAGPRGGKQAAGGGGRFAEKREAMKARAIERFDLNADGQLDETERAVAKAEAEQRTRATLLEHADTDASGSIDEIELAEFQARALEKAAAREERRAAVEAGEVPVREGRGRGAKRRSGNR